MIDPFTALGDQLFEAAQRLEANPALPTRKRWPLRRWLSRPLVLLASGVLVAACGASAAVVLSDHRSAPLSGRALNSRQYDIRMSPYLNAGVAGWCFGVRGSAPGHRSSNWGEFCDSELVGYPPIVASSATGATVNWAITTANVAAVRFGNSVVRTRTEPRLPNGFRAAVELLPPGQGAATPPLEALDARGRVIEWRGPSHPSFFGRKLPYGPKRAAGALGHPYTDTRYWAPPSRPPNIGCSIHEGALPGLRALWGDVLTRLQPVTEVQESALLSCADTEFYWEGQPLEAAVLLNAASPGSPPADLPQMKPVQGHPGVFDTPGGIQGHITARRVGDAWLVVQSQASLGQRLALLRDLRVEPLRR